MRVGAHGFPPDPISAEGLLQAVGNVPLFETRRVNKDGAVLDIWLMATRLMNSAGESYAIATTERDVRGSQTPG